MSARTAQARLFTALLFAAVATAVRASLPDVKTRLQIVALITVAAAVECFIRSALRQRRSWFGFIINSAAVILAMIAVKIAMEGRPHHPSWMLQAAASFRIWLAKPGTRRSRYRSRCTTDRTTTRSPTNRVAESLFIVHCGNHRWEAV